MAQFRRPGQPHESLVHGARMTFSAPTSHGPLSRSLPLRRKVQFNAPDEVLGTHRVFMAVAALSSSHSQVRHGPTLSVDPHERCGVRSGDGHWWSSSTSSDRCRTSGGAAWRRSKIRKLSLHP